LKETEEIRNRAEDTDMVKQPILVTFVILVGFSSARPQVDKPALVVETFTLASGVNWPYDMKQLQVQMATELKIKGGDQYNVLTEVPNGGEHTYTLQGEVLEWHAGNRAKRMAGMGSGREEAQIHYWLTEKDGKKVFEHTDTIRQASWGNAYANSVGELAQPFADKIAERLKTRR
jgi:hypothetical protein